jgi:glycerophosphoryl diester phosphodiesterase
MTWRTFRRIALAALIIVLILAFVVGGGFGAKANTAALGKVPLALFAHRAEQPGAPENSLEGVALSTRVGFAGVELDIRTSQEGTFVLFHDDSCQRMLGVAGLVHEHTLSALRAQPLLHHTIPSSAYVATLEEALDRYGDSLLFYLDMKVSSIDHADRIADLIEQRSLNDRMLVASSSVPFITYLEFHHPGILTVLEGFDKGEEWTWWLFPKNFRPDFVSSFAKEVDAPHAAWLKEQGLLNNKITYGLDSADEARLGALGLSRFIVDAH